MKTWKLGSIRSNTIFHVWYITFSFFSLSIKICARIQGIVKYISHFIIVIISYGPSGAYTKILNLHPLKTVPTFVCSHPADGVVWVQNKCEIRKCFTYWGGDRKKCNGHGKSFQKRSITLTNAWLPLHFMLWNGNGKPFQHVISFWLWANGIWTVL